MTFIRTTAAVHTYANRIRQIIHKRTEVLVNFSSVNPVFKAHAHASTSYANRIRGKQQATSTIHAAVP